MNYRGHERYENPRLAGPERIDPRPAHHRRARQGSPSRGSRSRGLFELPRLALLSAEDQVFVAAFVRSHGSIKEMEQVFGVSYPTIKARLNRIAGSLEFVETDPRSGPRRRCWSASPAAKSPLTRLSPNWRAAN